MKLFGILITASSLTSFAVGYVTEDIFNALSLYTPLALISIVVKDTLENRKVKKILEGK
ncbi:hypothetical protein QI276_04885 [Staphylococcus saprophyticus]|nr:hypothetical protein [Staphylococcus saprophyticus]